MTTETASRRSRIDDGLWAECLAAWRSGSLTLQEIADRCGVSVRAIQFRLKKAGARKGEAVTDAARKIEAATIAAMTDDDFDRIEAGRSARRRSFDLVTRLENAAADIIDAIASAPETAASYSSALRAMSHAMAVLDKGWGIKSAALSLKADGLEGEPLPEIIIRDLTDDDLQRIQQSHGVSDDDIYDDDDAS